MPLNNIELKDKPVKATELKSDLALATWFNTNRAIPQGGTPIKSGAQARKYLPLSLNATAKTAKDAAISAALWVDWKIQSTCDLERYPQYAEFDELLISFIKTNLHFLEYESFDNVIKAVLDSGVTYGYAIAELIWDSQDGWWMIDSIKPKPSFDFDINLDVGDNTQSLYYYYDSQYLNPEKFIIATFPFLRDWNPYGLSEFEAIAKDIQLLEELEQFFTKGASSVMNKLAVHWYNDVGGDPEQTRQRIETIGNAFKGGGGLISLPALPNDEKNELQKNDEFNILDQLASEDGLPAIEKRINELERRINRNFGIQDDLGSTTVNVGSMAKAQVEFNLFASKAYQYREWVKRIINRQVISRIVEMNYDVLPDNYTPPAFEWEIFEEDELVKRSDSIVNLYNAGLLTPNEARQALGLAAIDESQLPTPQQDQTDGQIVGN